MNFESFFADMESTPVKVQVEPSSERRRESLDNEALFQLPFICMVVLIFATNRRKPWVSQVGQLVGECFEATIPAFKGSSQHLGWSSNLRVRTVKAISFLELAKLVIVDNRNSRIKATTLGRKVLDRALRSDDDLSVNLTQIARAYRNIRVSKQLDLELTG